MIGLLRIACMGVCLLGAVPGRAASFDCREATAVDETAVCADPTLSWLDGALQPAYTAAKSHFADEVARLDRDFRADRKACGAARPCLTAAYVGFLNRLHGFGAPDGLPANLSALTISGQISPRTDTRPASLGDCTATQVATVGPRLSSGAGPAKPEDFDTGTGVAFTNKAVQVSYDREPKLIASRPGDPAVMCLVVVPRHCPKGDDRARFYTVTNLRTHQTWTLPDSQHMCGGA